MTLAVSIVAALLLAVGSGLIFVALLQLERRYREPEGYVTRGWLLGEGRRTSWPGGEESPGRAILPTGKGVRLLGPGSEIGPGRPQ